MADATACTRHCSESAGGATRRSRLRVTRDTRLNARCPYHYAECEGVPSVRLTIADATLATGDVVDIHVDGGQVTSVGPRGGVACR